MKRYISVPNETKRELRKIFGCTRVTVWNALNYKSNSEFARKIRRLAEDKGGVEYDESKQKSTNLK